MRFLPCGYGGYGRAMPVLVLSFRVSTGRAQIHRSTAIWERKTTLTGKMLLGGDNLFRRSAARSSACHWDLCYRSPLLTAGSVALSAESQTRLWGYI